MAAAAAPLRKLLLRLRDPPPLPAIPLLTRIASPVQQIPSTSPAPALPLPDSAPSEMAPSPSLRDALLSFHPGLQIRPCLDSIGEGEVLHDGVTTEVWADSVKKKRKRKMNKHKLRKLRRRLRRQT